MAATTTAHDPTDHRPQFDPFTGVDQVRELNRQVLENTRKAGEVSVDLYEKTVRRLADSHERIAAATGNDALTTAARFQAGLARSAAETYATNARAALRLAK